MIFNGRNETGMGPSFDEFSSLLFNLEQVCSINPETKRLIPTHTAKDFEVTLIDSPVSLGVEKHMHRLWNETRNRKTNLKILYLEEELVKAKTSANYNIMEVKLYRIFT